MTQDRDKIIDLIKKCLALTGSPNEHEAARAMEKAQDLLEKYNLEMDDVKDTPEVDSNGMIQKRYTILGRFKWRQALVHYVARRNFCKSIGHGRWHDYVDIAGRRVNVEATIEMVSWLLPQIERLAKQATRAYKIERDEETGRIIRKNAYRGAFLWGCITRINNRLYEAQQERIADNSDLTGLISRRDTEVAEYVAQVFGRLSSSGSARVTSSRGVSDGRTAGDKVNLYGRRSRENVTTSRLGPGGNR